MTLSATGIAGLQAPEALLFDLDGTLYRGEERIDGADRLISDLEKAGVPCLFVTNNSTRTPAEVARHLNDMGIPAGEGQIVTSAMAAAYYVSKNLPDAEAYVIGERGLRHAFHEAGVRMTDDGMESDAAANVVVQGLDRELTYGKLTSAVRVLLRGGAFVQTNPDRLLPVGDGFLPGAGTIGAALQAATGKEPVVIGKPSRILMDYALGIAGAEAERCWVIGDNPYTDIAAGNNAGCPSVLVLTGFCAADDWREHCRAAEAVPNAVCADLSELAKLLGASIHTLGV